MDRTAQTFPSLTAAQIERIAAVGRRTSVPAGEVLVEVGDQNTRFFVVLSGSVEIVQPCAAARSSSSVIGPGSSPAS